MSEPGFHLAIPEAEYHADPDSISASGLKTILRAPALFRHEQQNPRSSKSFDFGTAAHALVLGRGMEQVYIAPFHDWRTKQAQAERKLAQDCGLAPILIEDWLKVCDMADVLSSHTFAMELLSGGDAEVSAYAIDEPTGLMRRCRFDYIKPGVGSDYKSTTDASPEAFTKTVTKYGYDLSAAYYMDIAADLGRPLDAFALIAQEKDPPYLVEVYDLDADFLARGRRRYRAALERYRDCMNSDMWPGYTGQPFTTLSLPRWATYESETA